nr:YkgJ family cysteine cluster protein [Candidatus Sigynarchaeota archaeon]
MSETKEPKSKFKFTCTKCGACCENRGPVPLTISDLEAWASKKIIRNMFPYIVIHREKASSITRLVFNMINDQPASKAKEGDSEKDNASRETGASSEKKEGGSTPEGGDEMDDIIVGEIVEKGKCPMYNKETKACLIWADRPTYCRAFPLGFEDGSFFVEMEDCPGLATKEEMSKDLLKQMRDDAKRLADDSRQVGIVLPILQALVMNALQQANLRAMSKMSPEDMQKLNDIMQKMSQK